jgi:dihydroorotate dehydrogenase
MYRLLRPLLFALPPETAHRTTLAALAAGARPCAAFSFPVLETSVWGMSFRNPLGLAAGFDKDAVALPALFRMGFGFVEAGTVTPKPQDGNPRPRVFRDVQSRSIVNRMGFPGGGLDAFESNLRRAGVPSGVLGLNIGINKDTPNAMEDYCQGISRLAPYAEYIAINVSSPNTQGLRDLQAKAELEKLLDALVLARNEAAATLSRKVPLLLKIAPDLDDRQQADVANTVMTRGVDGLIVSNTTISRPEGLGKALQAEKGGLSGALLCPLALRMTENMYRLTEGRMPIIGVGGISNAQDAYARIRAGASLVQVYTALVYQGPDLVRSIQEGLVELLQKDGFSSVAQATGSGQSAWKKVV